LIKVHLVGECGDDYVLNSSTYIRLVLPLQLLVDEKHIELSVDTEYENYKDSDIHITNRTWSSYYDINSAIAFIKMIRSGNKKFIYEIDDNLLDIPNIPQSRKAIIYYFIKNADVVITSTPLLKKRIDNLSKNVIVIPNYLDSRLIKKRCGVFKENEKITIGYMGTFTHQRDFQMIKLPLMRVLQKYKENVRLEVLGAIEDESTLKSFPNTKVLEFSEAMDYFTFWDWMNENCYWDIGIAPLKYCEFTRCKSDVKYLDYSALGIAGIYSKHPSYSDTIVDMENGLLIENTCDVWEVALEKLIIDTELRNLIRKNAHEHLWKNRILQEHTDLWFQVIKSKGIN